MKRVVRGRTDCEKGIGESKGMEERGKDEEKKEQNLSFTTASLRKGGSLLRMHTHKSTHHFKENPDKLLRLSTVLGGEGGGGDIEERGPTLGGYGLGQQSLSSARRPHHQHTLGGRRI